MRDTILEGERENLCGRGWIYQRKLCLMKEWDEKFKLMPWCACYDVVYVDIRWQGNDVWNEKLFKKQRQFFTGRWWKWEMRFVRLKRYNEISPWKKICLGAVFRRRIYWFSSSTYHSSSIHKSRPSCRQCACGSCRAGSESCWPKLAGPVRFWPRGTCSCCRWSPAAKKKIQIELI